MKQTQFHLAKYFFKHLPSSCFQRLLFTSENMIKKFSHCEWKYCSSHIILRASAGVNWLCSTEFSETVSVFHGWQCDNFNLQNRLSSKRSSITKFNEELIFHLNFTLTPTVLPLTSIGSINMWYKQPSFIGLYIC